MQRPKKLRLGDLNPHLICLLCGGYYIDATTIIECLHSFCRTCIVRYLETSKFCPICDVQIHKTKPLLHIRSDKTLQDIVYKLVPSLFHGEMQRRRDFYAKHKEEASNFKTTPEDRGEAVDGIIISPDDSISLSLEYYDSEANEDTSDQDQNGENSKQSDKEAPHRRYLQCPAAVTMKLLMKFIRMKYGLTPDYKVDIIYQDECLPEDFTLMDVAYCFLWKRNESMRFSFRIFKPPKPRPALKTLADTPVPEAEEPPEKMSRLSESQEEEQKEEADETNHRKNDDQVVTPGPVDDQAPTVEDAGGEEEEDELSLKIAAPDPVQEVEDESAMEVEQEVKNEDEEKHDEGKESGDPDQEQPMETQSAADCEDEVPPRLEVDEAVDEREDQEQGGNEQEQPPSTPDAPEETNPEPDSEDQSSPSAEDTGTKEETPKEAEKVASPEASSQKPASPEKASPTPPLSPPPQKSPAPALPTPADKPKKEPMPLPPKALPLADFIKRQQRKEQKERQQRNEQKERQQQHPLIPPLPKGLILREIPRVAQQRKEQKPTSQPPQPPTPKPSSALQALDGKSSHNTKTNSKNQKDGKSRENGTKAVNEEDGTEEEEEPKHDDIGALDLSGKSSRKADSPSLPSIPPRSPSKTPSPAPPSPRSPAKPAKGQATQTILSIAQTLVNRQLSSLGLNGDGPRGSNRPTSVPSTTAAAASVLNSAAMRNLMTLSDTAVQIRNLNLAMAAARGGSAAVPGRGMRTPLPSGSGMGPGGRGVSGYHRGGTGRATGLMRSPPPPLRIPAVPTNKPRPSSLSSGSSPSPSPPAENGTTPTVRGKASVPPPRLHEIFPGGKPGPNQAVRHIPNPSLLFRQQAQSRLQQLAMDSRNKNDLTGNRQTKNFGTHKLPPQVSSIRKIENLTRNIEKVAAGLTVRAAEANSK